VIFLGEFLESSWGKTFWKKFFPKPLFKNFSSGEWDGWSFCNSGASNFVGTSPEKIVRDLVTSAQREVGLFIFCFFFLEISVEVRESFFVFNFN